MAAGLPRPGEAPTVRIAIALNADVRDRLPGYGLAFL